MGVDLDKQLVPVDVWPHPLTAEGRREALVREGLTLADVVREQKLGSRVVRAWIDGVEVPAELLEARTLKAGEIMTVRADVAGGRGGAGKIIRTLLQIAVLAAAAFVPAALGLAAGSLGASLVSAGVLFVGNLLINALVPPEVPRLDDPGSDRATPVYSLSGGGNRARRYAPLLLVLGEHRVFPDLAAAEYSTFEDGEQYLHQIFDFGLGDIEVDDLRSGPQLLSGFDGVEIYMALNGAAIPQIAGNVDTLQGAELTDTNWVRRTAPRCGKVQIDVVGRIFRINDEGETIEHTVSIQVRYSADGNNWTTRPTIDLVSESQTQLRKTVTIDLPGVRNWFIEVRRTTAPVDKDAEDATKEDERTYDQVAFTAVRAFQPDTGDYTGRNRVGIRFKASAQLQGRLDRISGRVRQKVPVWDGSQWTAPQASSNPAWISRWFSRGHFVGGRLVAGRGLAASRIDDGLLQSWGAWCDANSLTCNYVIDREQDVDAIQRIIARCGRASPSWQTGKLGVVYDRENQTPVAMINPGNIIQGTLGVEWVDTKVADEVVVRYVEPRQDWQWNSIRRTVPGTTGTPVQSATVTLNGVTSAAQAASMAGLLAAAHKYHKRRVTWEMAAEGLSIRRGNVVWIHHGLLDGGETGHLAGGTAAEVQLDREVTLPAGQNWLQVRLADGTIHTSAVTAGSAADRLRLTTALPGAPDSDGPAFDVLWRLYDASSPPLKFKVTAAEPLSDREVRLVAIDERPEYYAAATQGEVVTDTTHALPTVLWISAAKRWVKAGNVQVLEVEVVLTVAGPWEGGQIRVGRGTAESVRVVKELRGDDLKASWIEEPRGEITITAIPYHNGGLHLSGALSIDEFDLVDGLYDIDAPTDFAVSQLPDGTRKFSWTPPMDGDLAGIVIRYAAVPGDNSDPAWGVMTPAHKGVLTSSPWETEEIDAGDWVFAARALSTAGDLSAVVRASLELTGIVAIPNREYIYAVSPTPDLPANQLPDNDWPFDQPGTAGGLQWTDAAQSVTAENK
ncbi:hypothetical protein F4212_14055, partial [Candidatus Poribacteria bacterium]|nr:hypothetical protein [Candidatus Poribacteria bacterium]